MSQRATANPFAALWAPFGLTNTAVQASTRILTSAATIAFTSQQVIWLRLTKLATEGGTRSNQIELQRMVSEKTAALNESLSTLQKSGSSIMRLAPSALTDPKVAERLATKSAVAADRALQPFARRITANAKRLA